MKTKFLLIFIAVLGLVSLNSCNDDFMQQDDPQIPAEGNYLRTEGELSVYLNGLYEDYIHGHGTDWSNQNDWPTAIHGSRLMFGDIFSDNMVTRGARLNDRLSGKMTIPETGGSTGWSWGNLKQINYFIRNYKAAEASVADPKDLNKWLAEAYFFKAWDYFIKVRTFGDVPWFSVDLNIDSEELYAPRTPRAEVMDSVLMCINFAVEHLPNGNGPTGRINKDMANFLKARICLFEGTFRKYHTDLNLTSSSEKFLKEAVTACEAIMSSNKYSLYKVGDNPYWKLFALTSKEIAGNPEIILARYYDDSNEGKGHAAQRYYEINRQLGYRFALGATRGLVDEYLCVDGQPIYTGGAAGDYTPNELFLGYNGLWSELENRDPRLTQTICKPGEYISVWSQTHPKMSALYNGITYPSIGYNQNTDPGGTTVTGYRVIKHWMANSEEFGKTIKGSQAGIEFRYAEVLLNYAEAKCELGSISQDDIDKTINVLRSRAGFDFVKYPTSKLTIGNEPNDPRLDAIYAEKLDYTVSPLLREIRRERRVEFASENQRYSDLMRWKAGPLMSVPLRGMKITPDTEKLYDGTNRLPTDIKPPFDANNIPKVAVKTVLGKDMFVDNENFLIAYPKSTYFSDGTIPWQDFRYYWPIPTGEINKYKNNGKELKQSPGW